MNITVPSSARWAQRFLIGLALWALASLAAAQSFSDPLNTSSSNRPAADAPLAHITVSANVTVTQLAALNSIPAAHNIKFLIYDGTAGSFLYVSAAQPFAADAAGAYNWKQSTVFTPVTLLPGRDYYIGAISDQAGLWAFSTSGSVTQGAITSLMSNGNVSNYAVPAYTGSGAARIPLQLWETAAPPPPPSVAAVPTLDWLGLIALAGLLGGAAARRQRIRRRA